MNTKQSNEFLNVVDNLKEIIYNNTEMMNNHEIKPFR